MHFVVVWITLYETLFVDKQSISRYKHNMKEDVKKYLGLKVRAIREAAGMTQEELAYHFKSGKRHCRSGFGYDLQNFPGIQYQH